MTVLNPSFGTSIAATARWAGLRLAIYALAAAMTAGIFVPGAALYSFVWPAPPPTISHPDNLPTTETTAPETEPRPAASDQMVTVNPSVPVAPDAAKSAAPSTQPRPATSYQTVTADPSASAATEPFKTSADKLSVPGLGRVSARALVGVYVLGASDKPLGRIAAISQTPDRAPFARIVMMDLTSKDVIGIWEMTKVQLHARRINKVSGVSGGVVTNLNISDLNWSKRSSEDQKYQARITSQSSREILKQIGVSLADLP